MSKVWESSSVDVYFESEVVDKPTKRTFNNLVEAATEEQIHGFSNSLAKLTPDVALHSITNQKYRFTQDA